jgi:hypothetical protein
MSSAQPMPGIPIAQMIARDVRPLQKDFRSCLVAWFQRLICLATRGR